MSEYEYNNLLYKISKRLDKIHVGEQLLVICRGKLSARNEENIPTFSLFKELEEKGFLSLDRLNVLKAMLKGVEEWALLEEVEKFEAKRKEYNNLLERIIQVLDGLNDLERLLSICRRKITEPRQSSILNVRSLFKELESNGWLGIDCLDTLKEILNQTNENNLLKEVEEFEQRQNHELMWERQKAKAFSIASSVGDKVVGALNVKTVFKVIAGGFTIASSLNLLTRNSTYDELITAVNTCVLPAGANLIQITDGCLCLKVQLMDLSALETLWRLYKNGTLKASLQALFDTDEIREFAGGEHVEVIVTIDEREYDKARSELVNEAQELPQGEDGKQQRQYLDEQKLSNILKYLEESETKSATTETSDSGIRESCSLSSELETDESIDSPPTLYLKDLSEEVVEELTSRLQSDPVALKRFYQSFGLDPEKLYARGFQTIAEIFPGTSTKTLKDVFKALRLLDLVDLLENVTKIRALRPALSMKEIEMLPNASYRPIKDYSKAEILIIDCHNDASTENDAKRTGSFFQAFNSKSQVTTLTAAKALVDLLENLAKLSARMTMNETDALVTETRETMLKVFLEEKISDKWSGGLNRKWNETVAEKNERQLSLFQEEELAMRTELRELVEKRQLWANERMLMIEEIEQEEEKLKRENEKFAATVVSLIDKWITLPHDEGEESTLFVVLVIERFKLTSYSDDVEKFIKMIGECVRKTLSLIPGTKLLIANTLSCLAEKAELPSETLQVYAPKRIGLTTMLDLLKKRWKTLDLISVMQELKRTLRSERISRKQEETMELWDRNIQAVEIQENLSFLPRLQKTD